MNTKLFNFLKFALLVTCVIVSAKFISEALESRNEIKHLEEEKTKIEFKIDSINSEKLILEHKLDSSIFVIKGLVRELKKIKTVDEINNEYEKDEQLKKDALNSLSDDEQFSVFSEWLNNLPKVQDTLLSK